MGGEIFKTLILKQVIDNIINDFAHISCWEEKYEYLIELGHNLKPLHNNLKTDHHLIHGCQSKVWLVCKYEDEKLHFYGDSDALITKGLVALIVKVYSGCQAEELLKENGQVFSTIGLQKHLSMNRANGLNIMIKTVQNYGLKYIKNG